jgi:hypothetical protein
MQPTVEVDLAVGVVGASKSCKVALGRDVPRLSAVLLKDPAFFGREIKHMQQTWFTFFV